MELIKEELATIEAQISRMNDNIEFIRPPRPRFRLFPSLRLKAARQLTQKSASDALNHAAAFIGYFDGITARGSFQRRTSEGSPRKASRTLHDVLDYVQWVLSEILAVVTDYLTREPLNLSPGGPTKPGPRRTAQVCVEHLARLDRMVGALVYQAASSDEQRTRVSQRYDD